MNTRLCPLMLLVVVVCLGQAVPSEAAQDDRSRPLTKAAAEQDQGSAFVSTVTELTGERLLVIEYPWKRHARPSIEVRLLDQSEVENRLIRPLFFQHNIMKGAITEAVYRCQDRSDELRQTATFSKGDVDFDIFGARNSLGRPSVCVACRTTDSDDAPPETRAAFCLLDAWAVDDHTLYLQLPDQYFSKSSKLRVWLLRGKDIVWTATTTWPGTSESSSPVSGGEAP